MDDDLRQRPLAGRLLRLLTNPQRPVQLILAGKAHPGDQAGKALIQQWYHAAKASRFHWESHESCGNDDLIDGDENDEAID